MALQLAGFADDRDGAVAEGLPGEPTLRGTRLAEQHGITRAELRPEHADPDRAGEGGKK